MRNSLAIILIIVFSSCRVDNPFLNGEPEFFISPVFEDERFPNVVVSSEGTVLLSWGNKNIRVRRSINGGLTYEEPIVVQNPGFQGGGMLVNEFTKDILLFVEKGHPISPLTLYKSTDDGLSWDSTDYTIKPDKNGIPSMHMNESGLTLVKGEFKGRLIRPTRWYDKGNNRDYWDNHYTNAMYSDDNGITWNTSEPFPVMGTGEAAIVELADGTLYYNSRRHHSTDGQSPRWRYSAISKDGGETWTDSKLSDVLPDGDKDRDYGLMGGLCRIPLENENILLFSNIDSESGRKNGVVWVSFDGGYTWPVSKIIDSGSFAYSSMTAGRVGTPSEGYIFLFYESDGGGKVARFNLPWLLDGKDLKQFLK